MFELHELEMLRHALSLYALNLTEPNDRLTASTALELLENLIAEETAVMDELAKEDMQWMMSFLPR